MKNSKTNKFANPYPDRMVRLSWFTAATLDKLTPRCKAYWAEIDRKAGRDAQPVSASDVIRTALQYLEEDFNRRNIGTPTVVKTSIDTAPR